MNETVNILIVDDVERNIFALQQMLAHPRRNILGATSGREALKLVLNKEIDLIILDVQMPEMDGFEVAQILKSNKGTQDIPIIFASAERKDHEYMMRGYETGAVDYLFKPLDKDLTEAKISILLKLHLQRKELLEKNQRLERAEAEIRALNDALSDRLALLEQANREMESFSYSVSHDLRAPLRAINGFTAIIQEDHYDKLDDEVKRLFEVILNNSTRMGHLIDDLLAFSRLGRQELSKTKLNVQDLVQRVLQEMRDLIPPHVKLVVSQLTPIEGDYRLLYQVFYNLISNAVKYSSKKPEAEIEISCSEREEDCVYSVRDNGVGFNMKYVHKLFGVFQRLHRPEEFEGTGVGLAIVQRIVVRHGGSVWAEGEIDKGATFSFSLPKARVYVSS